MFMNELTKKGTGYIISFLAGGVVGAGVALLLAPKSGKEVRTDIKRFAGTAKDRVIHSVDKGKTLYEEGRSAVAHVIDAGKTAFTEEKEKWQHARV
jgi:gas vesicle protein